ncbi:MAG: universal stress protein [Rickettsiales bacterium]|jgi:nucleotide-binding universal stress UspA family protein
MKTILVPLEESDVLPSILECALIVAKRFNSYIEGLYEQPGLTEVVVAGEGLGVTPPDLVETFQQQEKERAVRAHELFETFMKEKGIPLNGGGAPQSHPTAGWVEEEIPGRDLVGNRGRLFDLIVVGRPVRSSATPTMSLLEAALFETGRPILIAPPKPPSGLGKHIVISWNGSYETPRCISFAMPLLLSAEKVTVLQIEEGMVPGPSAADATIHLRRNGIDANAVNIEAGRRTAGEAVLEEAEKLNADLLLKGAYTRSRLRQMIFGGITSHILDAAEIPVLMCH